MQDGLTDREQPAGLTSDWTNITDDIDPYVTQMDQKFTRNISPTVNSYWKPQQEQPNTQLKGKDRILALSSVACSDVPGQSANFYPTTSGTRQD